MYLAYNLALNDFIIQDGMRYQLRGPSGRGKTSFLSYLLGHRKDYNGEVFINNRAVLDINIDEWVELSREKISSVFQDLQRNHLLLHVVEAPDDDAERAAGWPAWSGPSWPGATAPTASSRSELFVESL